jgi:hypothetical protein
MRLPLPPGTLPKGALLTPDILEQDGERMSCMGAC